MSLTLITGSPGWLGNRLVNALANGLLDYPDIVDKNTKRKIRCLVLKGSDISELKKISNDLEIVEGNLCDLRTVKEFCTDAKDATIFHCAGIIHPRRRVKEFYDVNVKGTENLLTAAYASGAKRMVIMSSNSPIGVTKNREQLFNESSPYNPYMNYGKSKMEMEKIVRAYQQDKKIETVIVRAPWFYGPAQPLRQTVFFTMIKNGKAPIVGDGNNKRSMSYVDNLCYGLILCEKTEKANGQVYWISDERPYTMNEVISTIEELLEKEFNIKVAHKRLRLPDFAGEIATFADGFIQSTGFYNQKVHVLSEMNKTIACSVQKAKNELGYKPKIELKEGMKRSLKWCINNGVSI